MRGPGANNETAERLEQVSAVPVEFGIVGYTHAGGVDRPLVAYKTAGGNTGAVVLPHMNSRGLFSMGTAPSGAGSTVPVEWPGFRTTAYHSMGETQAITKNWMGSLLEEQRDAGGQMYMRNRYYDPKTGQFTQADPIGLAGGLNTYGFAAGDPVSYDDPYGLCPPCRGNENTPEAVEREAQMVENRTGRDALLEGATVALGVSGGIAFLTASTEAAIASAPTLAQRARELHGVLSTATQRRTTTAVARVVTESGRVETWVASSERVLRPGPRAMLRSGERAIRGSGHAEVTILNAAQISFLQLTQSGEDLMIGLIDYLERESQVTAEGNYQLSISRVPDDKPSYTILSCTVEEILDNEIEKRIPGYAISYVRWPSQMQKAIHLRLEGDIVIDLTCSGLKSPAA